MRPYTRDFNPWVRLGGPMEDIIIRYGHLAIFVGCLLEGETILVRGALAAFRGYLDLERVILVAVIGSFIGDQLYFYLGRRSATKHFKAVWLDRPTDTD